jgi:hypothetical protein
LHTKAAFPQHSIADAYCPPFFFQVLEVAEMVVGKNACDLVTSDVEMALAFVLERKIYGVSVKNVLGHLPDKHPQSLEAMQKQFQKSIRRVSA